MENMEPSADSEQHVRTRKCCLSSDCQLCCYSRDFFTINMFVIAFPAAPIVVNILCYYFMCCQNYIIYIKDIGKYGESNFAARHLESSSKHIVSCCKVK